LHPFSLNDFSLSRISLLLRDNISADNIAAFIAPAFPIDIVATGTPFGICTVDNNESRPPITPPSRGIPIKANSTLPVIGIPLEGGVMGGLDSLLSTVQMPKGVPVATMSIGKAGAINAAILSAEILSLNNNEILDKLKSFKENGCKL
jgi:hypothetical protein